MQVSLRNRFYNRITVGHPPSHRSELGPCWLFPKTHNQGYGQIAKTGASKTSLAHRISWELNRGNIPTGLCVLHKCDVRNCVRPDHLFLGTKTDNHFDKVQKGRSNRGERNRGHKMTELKVLRIRSLLGSKFRLMPAERLQHLVEKDMDAPQKHLLVNVRLPIGFRRAAN